MSELITYVGLDVHKETIAVALAEAGKRNEVREYGKIANTATAVKALAARLAHGGRELRFCYEAGPCGYGVQRQLTAAGHGCVVVARSLIPRKPGDRIKTDRRDAVNLAKLHRAGELTPVWVPDQAHEAIRDLVRAGLAAVRSLRQARQQLSGFLLRHGHHYHRPAWTAMHRRWLAGLRFEQPVHHIVLEDCIAVVEAATRRAVSGLGDAALAPRPAAGMLGRHQTEIRHELAWIVEARDVAEFGRQCCRRTINGPVHLGTGCQRTTIRPRATASGASREYYSGLSRPAFPPPRHAASSNASSGTTRPSTAVGWKWLNPNSACCRRSVSIAASQTSRP